MFYTKHTSIINNSVFESSPQVPSKYTLYPTSKQSTSEVSDHNINRIPLTYESPDLARIPAQNEIISYLKQMDAKVEAKMSSMTTGSQN